MNFNKAIIVGRLVRDPEVRSLPSGQQVTNFSMATSRFFTDKAGNKQQQSEFHNIVAFRRLAEISSQYLKKGSMALIEGEIRTRNWEDKTGNKRYTTEIIASSLQLGPRSAGENSSSKEYEKKEDKKEEQDFSSEKKEENIPVIDEEEIDINDIPF